MIVNFSMNFEQEEFRKIFRFINEVCEFEYTKYMGEYIEQVCINTIAS